MPRASNRRWFLTASGLAAGCLLPGVLRADEARIRLFESRIAAIRRQIEGGVTDTPAPAAPEPASWPEADAIVARIREPSFPARDVYLNTFGAFTNGVDDNTAVFERAIEACAAAGGGRVVVPAGRYATGPIYLKSNVNLHLEEGAVLLFNNNPDAYLPVVRTRFEANDVFNYRPLVYAFGETNIALTGKGVLNGQADTTHWWPFSGLEEFGWREGIPNENRAIARLREQGETGVPVEQRVYGDGFGLRPSFIQPYNCERVLIEGVTVTNSPMWGVHPLLSREVVVRGVTVASQGPNNDGLDVESCDHVLVENCRFDTRDDCVVVKSGRGREAIENGTPSQNIVVRGCRMSRGIGGIAFGSETSAGIRNVYAENLEMDDPRLEHAVYMKSSSFRGGTVETVRVRGVRSAGTAVSGVFITYDYLFPEGSGPYTPTFRDIQISDVTVNGTESAIRLVGYPGNPLSGVTITNSTFTNVTGPRLYTRNVGDIEVNVIVNGRQVTA